MQPSSLQLCLRTATSTKSTLSNSKEAIAQCSSRLEWTSRPQYSSPSTMPSNTTFPSSKPSTTPLSSKATPQSPKNQSTSMSANISITYLSPQEEVGQPAQQLVSLNSYAPILKLYLSSRRTASRTLSPSLLIR